MPDFQKQEIERDAPYFTADQIREEVARKEAREAAFETAMVPERVSVIVLRRELPEEKIGALRKLYPGKELDIQLTNPADFQEHDNDCTKLNADVVVLPERPIPATAMERGIPHVAITEDGQVWELLPLKPEFKPFAPCN